MTSALCPISTLYAVRRRNLSGGSGVPKAVLPELAFSKYAAPLLTDIFLGVIIERLAGVEVIVGDDGGPVPGACSTSCLKIRTFLKHVLARCSYPSPILRLDLASDCFVFLLQFAM
jgi:hypothetical protein